MILTSLNLASYLIDRGLVKRASVVDGDWVVVEAAWRNRTFRALRRAGPGYFVKQLQDWGAASARSLECEAVVYGQAQGRADVAAWLPAPPWLRPRLGHPDAGTGARGEPERVPPAAGRVPAARRRGAGPRARCVASRDDARSGPGARAPGPGRSRRPGFCGRTRRARRRRATRAAAARRRWT